MLKKLAVALAIIALCLSAGCRREPASEDPPSPPAEEYEEEIGETELEGLVESGESY